jgi:4-hydroxybenzoate polyprenyltransferase
MSKADKLKEEIGWLKVMFGILVATDISLVAWLAQNYSTASVLLLTFCGLAVIIVTGAIVWVNRTAYRKIDELEDL